MIRLWTTQRPMPWGWGLVRFNLAQMEIAPIPLNLVIGWGHWLGVQLAARWTPWYRRQLWYERREALLHAYERGKQSVLEYPGGHPR